MTDDLQSLREDIDYLKGLASAGQEDASGSGPLILMAAGLFFGGGSFVQWLVLDQVVPLPPIALTIGWTVAMLGFFGTLIAVKAGRGGGTSDRGAALAWRGSGWALFTVFVAIAVATWRTHDMNLIRFSPSIVLALYGAGWSVAAAITRKGWIWITSMASFAAAIGSAWFVAQNIEFLLYAIALLALAFVPGLMLRRAARMG